MKKMLLVRHAKSSWSDPNLKDEERPLNDRGERDAPFMAQYCKSQGLHLTHLISSTAVRAHSTAQAFHKVFNAPLEKESDLYFGDESDWLYVINNLENNIGFPAFFSHNPTITYFANLFEGDNFDNIPTCGCIYLVSKANKWKDVNYSNTQIMANYFPKLVKKQ